MVVVREVVELGVGEEMVVEERWWERGVREARCDAEEGVDWCEEVVETAVEEGRGAFGGEDRRGHFLGGE